MMKLASVIVMSSMAFSGVAAGDALLKLTDKTFEDAVMKSGANSFVKFFAPWCGHCKAMAPAWEALAEKYAGDTSVNIAEVDCTVHDKVCGKYEVRGYPTIKYFTEKGGFKAEEYNGGRDAAAFEKHVEDNLSVPCTPSKLGKCTDKQKEYIKKMEKKEVADLEKELERLNKMGSAKVAADKMTWLLQRKALLPHLIKSKEEL